MAGCWLNLDGGRIWGLNSKHFDPREIRHGHMVRKFSPWPWNVQNVQVLRKLRDDQEDLLMKLSSSDEMPHTAVAYWIILPSLSSTLSNWPNLFSPFWQEQLLLQGSSQTSASSPLSVNSGCGYQAKSLGIMILADFGSAHHADHSTASDMCNRLNLSIDLDIWRFPEIGLPPVIIHF